MNALDQTRNPELISKIAAVANVCNTIFPRGEILLAPFTQENMGEKWDDYVEMSQTSVDFAIKTKAGILSIYIVTQEDDIRKCNFVIMDYVSDNLRYVWEGEFDFLKKTKKELMLNCQENGNLPTYLRAKINELCGSLFYIFDPLSK